MSTVRKVTYLDLDEDRVILEWLTSQRNEASTIRQALRAYIVGPAGISHQSLDETVLETALERALNSTALRQLMEAAVTTALQQLTVNLPRTDGSDDYQADMDDDLTDSFLIE